MLTTSEQSVGHLSKGYRSPSQRLCGCFPSGGVDPKWTISGHLAKDHVCAFYQVVFTSSRQSLGHIAKGHVVVFNLSWQSFRCPAKSHVSFHPWVVVNPKVTIQSFHHTWFISWFVMSKNCLPCRSIQVHQQFLLLVSCCSIFRFLCIFFLYIIVCPF